MSEAVAIKLIENIPSIVTALAMLLTALASSISVWRTGKVNKKIDTLGVSVNGHLSEVKTIIERASHAEGKLEAIQERKGEDILTKAAVQQQES